MKINEQNFIKRNMKKNETDEWLTPESAVIPLVEQLRTKGFKIIWCPFDLDDSNYVKVLKENGFTVINSHLENGQDFFTYEPSVYYDAIISNPPYTLRNEVLKRIFDLNKPFALLLNYSGLFDNQKRFNLFKENGIELFILKGRTGFIRRSNGFCAKPLFQSIYLCHNIFDEKIIYQS